MVEYKHTIILHILKNIYEEDILLQTMLAAVCAIYILLVLMETEFLTVISVKLHKLIEIQFIFLQDSLHIIQSCFVRIQSSERDVEAYWKEKKLPDSRELQVTVLRPRREGRPMN
jgi:hypothetical protein